MSLLKSIQELEDSIRIARQSRVDISADYDGREDYIGYEVQQQLRLASRGIIVRYIDSTGLGERFSEDEIDARFPPVNPVKTFGKSSPRLPEDILERTLKALSESKELFGAHPFHHVIDGRLAFIVQRELLSGNSVPDEFKQAYETFEFKPWNCPFANYNSPRDTIKHGEPIDINVIPPEFPDKERN